MEPLIVEQSPLYLNWSFWAVVVAALAILLSQLPPIRLWFKRAKVGVEVYSRIIITHKVGNPNAQLHLIVVNTGGRNIRLKAITLDFFRNREFILSLPLQNFYQNIGDKETVLFTPILLKPEEEWAHFANFLNFFNRDDERRYRDAESNLRQDIIAKRRLEPDSLVEADNHNVRPLLQFFEEKFAWHSGEYEVVVKVDTDRASTSRRYLFTIFESESAELRAITESYKYGAGVYWNPESGSNAIVAIQLNELEA